MAGTLRLALWMLRATAGVSSRWFAVPPPTSRESQLKKQPCRRPTQDSLQSTKAAMAPVMSILACFSAVAAQFAALATAQGTCPTLTSNIAAPQMAPGYASRLFMTGLRNPRGLAFDTEGNLLVTEQGGAGVRWVKIRDNGGINVCVGEEKQLIPNGQVSYPQGGHIQHGLTRGWRGAKLNHGIALSVDGKILYVSTSTDVLAYPYDAAAGTVGSPRTLITGMHQGGSHQSRTLLVPQNNPNLLLVSRGSIDNVDAPTAQVESGRSMV
jgi:glucose/arabinose dehydrogenase